MGLSTSFTFHARHCDGTHREDDRDQEAAVKCRRRGGFVACLVALAVSTGAQAEALRIGFLNAELQRKGPGLLLRDILKGEAADISAVIGVIADVDPDLLVISGFDHDHGLAALSAFRDQVAGTGPNYPHLFSPLPNSGLATAFDLDGDGLKRGARDAQGYGSFAGQGGLALLSRLPVIGTEDFSHLLWRDLPETLMLKTDHGWDVQRLSSVAHIAITLGTPTAPLTLLAFHATPPVFDGPDDRNGRRNHDEAAFWLRYLEGAFGRPPRSRFVLLGDANLDVSDGDGRPGALTALLAHPALSDPVPTSDEAREAARDEAGVNTMHTGDPALDTANWRDGPGDPGNLRVDYVLPSRDWRVRDAGVAWGAGDAAPRHGLVWVDLEDPG